MPIFEKRSRIAATPERVFAFHELPDALERLTPPWQHARVVHKDPGLQAGVRVVLEMRLGPVKVLVEARHVAYEKGRFFQDEMVRGPFAKWLHTHRMEPDGDGCLLTDHVEYELPFGALGRLGGGWIARRELERLFAYRHRVTRETCEKPGPLSAATPG